jgi:hypothetical protein
MKFLFSVWVLSSLLGTLSAQVSDTSCLDERWVIIKPSTENRVFFPMQNKQHPEIGLLNVISGLTFQGKISISRSDLFLTIIHSNQYAPRAQYKIDKVKKLYITDYIEIVGSEAVIPLANSFGEDSIEITDQGEILFVYPPKDTLQLRMSEVIELRIHEQREYFSATDSYKMVANGLCIVSNTAEHGEQEVFWIRLDELYDHLKNPEQYAWYEALTKGKYHGISYQYMRCGSHKLLSE